MSEMWGYKIPLHPNDKGARAAHRAAAKHCLIQVQRFVCYFVNIYYNIERAQKFVSNYNST